MLKKRIVTVRTERKDVWWFVECDDPKGRGEWGNIARAAPERADIRLHCEPQTLVAQFEGQTCPQATIQSATCRKVKRGEILA